MVVSDEGDGTVQVVDHLDGRHAAGLLGGLAAQEVTTPIVLVALTNNVTQRIRPGRLLQKR